MKAQNKGLSFKQLILWGRGCRGGSLAGDHWGCPTGGMLSGGLGAQPLARPLQEGSVLWVSGSGMLGCFQTLLPLVGSGGRAVWAPRCPKDSPNRQGPRVQPFQGAQLGEHPPWIG